MQKNFLKRLQAFSCHHRVILSMFVKHCDLLWDSSSTLSTDRITTSRPALLPINCSAVHGITSSGWHWLSSTITESSDYNVIAPYGGIGTLTHAQHLVIDSNLNGDRASLATWVLKCWWIFQKEEKFSLKKVFSALQQTLVQITGGIPGVQQQTVLFTSSRYTYHGSKAQPMLNNACRPPVGGSIPAWLYRRLSPLSMNLLIFFQNSGCEHNFRENYGI